MPLCSLTIHVQHGVRWGKKAHTWCACWPLTLPYFQGVRAPSPFVCWTCGFQGTRWTWVPALPLTEWVNWGKPFHLSKLQFPYLSSGDKIIPTFHSCCNGYMTPVFLTAPSLTLHVAYWIKCCQTTWMRYSICDVCEWPDMFVGRRAAGVGEMEVKSLHFEDWEALTWVIVTLWNINMENESTAATQTAWRHLRK